MKPCSEEHFISECDDLITENQPADDLDVAYLLDLTDGDKFRINYLKRKLRGMPPPSGTYDEPPTQEELALDPEPEEEQDDDPALEEDTQPKKAAKSKKADT